MWLDSLKTLGWPYPVPSILFHLSSSTTLSSHWWPFPHQFFRVSLELRSTNLDLLLQMCPNKCQMDWDNHSLRLALCPLVDATCGKVCFHCCEGTLLEYFQVAIHQDHPSCARHPFNCCVGLLHPRCIISHLSLLNFMQALLACSVSDCHGVSMRWLFAPADLPLLPVWCHLCILWNMNMYPGRTVSGMLTGKGSVVWVNRQYPVRSELYHVWV